MSLLQYQSITDPCSHLAHLHVGGGHQPGRTPRGPTDAGGITE